MRHQEIKDIKRSSLETGFNTFHTLTPDQQEIIRLGGVDHGLIDGFYNQIKPWVHQLGIAASYMAEFERCFILGLNHAANTERKSA